jgi:folate-binding protein YgfZ
MTQIFTISVTGPDAFEFLQGQLTNDLKRLESETEILAAWCNPKGRVIWFGTARSIAGGYGLSAPVETADAIVNRLTMFRFRSKVDFEICDDGITIDPTALIKAGHPFIGPDQVEQFTPHMLNLDLLDAISLDKGCYTGQEIVARTHYKGATKRRTLRFTSDSPVSAGDKITLDGRDIGEVLNVAGNELLAVIPTAKASDNLRVGSSSLALAELPYEILTV